MTASVHRGIWVTLERPWSLVTGGTPDEALLVVECPDSVVAPFEWIEEGKGYREALVPADLLNGYPVARAWECVNCGAIELEGSPDWSQEPTQRGETVTVTVCPSCR